MSLGPEADMGLVTDDGRSGLLLPIGCLRSLSSESGVACGPHGRVKPVTCFMTDSTVLALSPSF